jgi:hypothetical protein
MEAKKSDEVGPPRNTRVTRGDSVRGAEAVGIVIFGGQGEGKFLAESAFFEEALFFEPILLATLFPVVRVWQRVRLVHNIFLRAQLMWGGSDNGGPIRKSTDKQILLRERTK